MQCGWRLTQDWNIFELISTSIFCACSWGRTVMGKGGRWEGRGRGRALNKRTSDCFLVFWDQLGKGEACSLNISPFKQKRYFPDLKANHLMGKKRRESLLFIFRETHPLVWKQNFSRKYLREGGVSTSSQGGEEGAETGEGSAGAAVFRSLSGRTWSSAGTQGLQRFWRWNRSSGRKWPGRKWRGCLPRTFPRSLPL